MSYRTQALLANDSHLIARATACAATQGIAEPYQWVYTRKWKLSAQPGFDAAYAYAITAGIPNPGNDEGCITDGMLLSSVQGILTAEAPQAP